MALAKAIFFEQKKGVRAVASTPRQP